VSTDTAQYIYVESAMGSVTFRNNVRHLNLIDGYGKVEAYASYQRATLELWNYIRDHKNKKGKPTIAGFPGATWTPFLPLDFDAEGDPSKALGWLRQVVLRLEEMGVDRRALRCFFSGYKGFHLELPATLFGGFEPSVALHKHLKRAAERLMGDIPFDSAIYDKLRLWRLEGSRNGKGKRYKIRLTAHEVLTLDLPSILALAEAPRSLDSIPDLALIADDDWFPVDELVSIWTLAQHHAETDTRERQTVAVTDDSRDRLTIAAIAAEWPHKPIADERTSRHTHYLMPLAGFLTGATTADHTAALLKTAAEHAADQSFLNGRDWEAEIDRLAEGSATRRTEGQEFTGYYTLRERFPALASVLVVLWAGLEDESADMLGGIGSVLLVPARTPSRLSARAELRRAMGLTETTGPAASVFSAEIPDYTPKPRPRPTAIETPRRPDVLLLRPAKPPTAQKEPESTTTESAAVKPPARRCRDCKEPIGDWMMRCVACHKRWNATPTPEDLPF